MKNYYVSIITGLLLATFTSAGELPFQALMTEEEVGNFAMLASDPSWTPEDVYNIIKSHMEGDGRLTEAHHIPYAHILEADEIADYYALYQDGMLVGELEALIRESLRGEGRLPDDAQPFGPAQPVAQLYAAPYHVAPHHAAPYHAAPHPVAHPVQPAIIAGHYGDALHHHFAPHFHQEDVEDPLQLSDAAFKDWKSKRQNLTLASVQNLYAHTDINDVIYSEKAFSLLLAAAEFGELEAFQFMAESQFGFYSNPPQELLDSTIQSITQSKKDPRYFKAFLHKPDQAMCTLVAQHLNASNANLHQTYVDKCAGSITRDIAKRLVNVKYPEAVTQLLAQAEADPGNVIHIKTLNTVGPIETGAAISHSCGNIQVAGLFSDPKSVLKLPQDCNLAALEAALLDLPPSEHFCCIHIGKESGLATVLRSLSQVGPSIGILHYVEAEAGYFHDEALSNFHVDPQRSTIKMSLVLKPKDVIVGMSEGYIKDTRAGFTSGILEILPYAPESLDTVDGVTETILKSSTPSHATKVIVGVVPDGNAKAAAVVNEEPVKKEPVKEDRSSKDVKKESPIGSSHGGLLELSPWELEAYGSGWSSVASSTDDFPRYNPADFEDDVELINFDDYND